MKRRLAQAVAVAVLVIGAFLAYEGVVGPDPKTLVRFAEDRLKSIFGPRVEYAGFRIDLVDGVEILGLKVYPPTGETPTLEARRVAMKHDVLALSSGVYRPEDIVIEGARILTHETESGMEVDFPFTLASDDETHARVPAIRIENATLVLRARRGTPRLGVGRRLVLRDAALKVEPRPDGTLSIGGGLYTTGLGQDDVRIRVEGTADARADTLDVTAVWDPLLLTPSLLGTLPPDIGNPLGGSQGSRGRLEVRFTRGLDPPGSTLTPGELRVVPRWIGEIRMDLAKLPGVESFDEKTLERLRDLFGKGVLDVQLAGGRVEVKGLTTQVGSATVRASGWIEENGERLRFDFEVRGLHLDDPILRKAAGEAGSRILDDFDVHGIVNADVRLLKEPGKDLAWEVDGEIVDADIRIIGTEAPGGHHEGFPYPVHHANGKFRFRPGVVWIDGVEGRNGTRTVVRMLPFKDHTSWSGEETGRIRFTDAGPDLRLTVEAIDVPVDADFRDAVAGSEFYEMGDRFRLGGVIDKIEVDLVVVPGVDKRVRCELRITLDGEEFAWSKFPMPIRDVRGVVTYRRPIVNGVRGRVYDVEATARTWDGERGADVTLSVAMDDEADLGRLRVTGKAIPLDGDLGRTILGSELTRDKLAKVWRFLDPKGTADVEGDFPLGKEPGPIRIAGDLAGASVGLNAGESENAIRFTDLVGRIEAVEDHVTLPQGVTGRIEGAPVRMKGTIDGADGVWDVTLDTDPLPLTPTLLKGLEQASEGGGLMPGDVRLESGGRVALSVHVTKPAGAHAKPKADVAASGLDLGLRIGEGPPFGVSGGRLVVKDGEVRAEGVTITLPGLRANVESGRFGPKGTSGRFVVALEDFALTEEILSLIPEDSRSDVLTWLGDRLVTSENLVVEVSPDGGVRASGGLALVAREGAPAGKAPRGSIALEGLSIPPKAAGRSGALAGTVRFKGFTMDPGVSLEDLRGTAVIDALRLGDDLGGEIRVTGLSGRVEGVRFRDLSAPLSWRDGILTADPIAGILSEGALRGRFVMHTRDPEAFEGDVSVTSFDLEALKNDLAPTGAPYRGTGMAQVAFQSRGGGVEDLTAAGRITVRDGNLGDLPAFANLIALLSRLLPGDCPPVFERADLDFTLKDEVFHFSRFDLAGDLFEMPGKGRLDLTGQVDLTFTPDFIKSMILPGALQIPVIGDVLEGVLQEDLLYAIRISGDLSNAKPELVLFPPLGLSHSRGFEGTGVPPPPPRRIPRLFR